MDCAQGTVLATDLLRERTEEGILARLELAKLPEKNQVQLLAQLLVLTSMDRDRLQDRLAAMIASRFGHSSEKASKDQLVLFTEAIRRIDACAAAHDAAKAGSEAPPPSTGTSGGESAPADPATPSEGTPQCSSEEGAAVQDEPKLPPGLQALVDRTDWEIKELVAAKRAAAEALREQRKQAMERERQAENASADTQSPPWPPGIPVKMIDIPVTDHTCPADGCGCQRPTLRWETSWRLEEVVSYQVVVIRREVVACPRGHETPESAPQLPNIVPRGHLGLDLSVRILWWRFTQNLPVCRIVEMLAVEGVQVSEEMIHTLCDYAEQLVKPVVA